VFSAVSAIPEPFDDSFRALCEARSVASMYPVSRESYYKDVAKRRGETKAAELRAAVEAELRRK
jgi:hypothetical protein